MNLDNTDKPDFDSTKSLNTEGFRYSSSRISRRSRSAAGILRGIIAFCKSADERSFEDFRAAVTFTIVIQAFSPISNSEIARSCNASPATFTRWKLQFEDDTIVTPHPALVSALFRGLKEIATSSLEDLAK